MSGRTPVQLNRALLESGFNLPPELELPSPAQRYPERVVQFGEGNFLRAFADWMFQRLNVMGLFGGSIVIVQPLAEGTVEQLNRQDGLYTLLLRGFEKGKIIDKQEIITAVSRGINPYQNWPEVLALAEDPYIEYVLSNTTEAGIAYDRNDSFCYSPPRSFPGKLAAYLYHRYSYFLGDLSKGMIIIPCELIAQNGDRLKEIILKLAEDWHLEAGFSKWITEANIFLNTLVDRVVTGFPTAETEQLKEQLGYDDKLITVAEPFHLWVIEGPGMISKKLPFTLAGLNVIWTSDLSPYRTRKVSILNGVHTASAPAAYLSGLKTVREMVDHHYFGQFIREIIFEEIIPSIYSLDEKMLTDYAADVLTRFKNPYIIHELEDILTNSISKFNTRVLPPLLNYQAQNGCLPVKISFSLAALLCLYSGGRHAEIGNIKLKDDPEALKFLEDLWAEFDQSPGAAAILVKEALACTRLWEHDLNTVPGLSEAVTMWLTVILNKGISDAVIDTIEKERT
jgi:tagaturonate reductase